MIQNIVETYLRSWMEVNKKNRDDSSWDDTQMGDDDSWYQRSITSNEERVNDGQNQPENLNHIRYYNVENIELATGPSVELKDPPKLEDYIVNENRIQAVEGDYRPPSGSQKKKKRNSNTLQILSISRPNSGQPNTSSDGVSSAHNRQKQSVSKKQDSPAASRPASKGQTSDSQDLYNSERDSERRSSRGPSPGPPSSRIIAQSELDRDKTDNSHNENNNGDNEIPLIKSNGIDEMYNEKKQNRRQDRQKDPEVEGSNREKYRSNSGKRKNERSADPAAFERIREELKDVTNKIEAMYLSKLDSEAAAGMLRTKADAELVNQKADVKVIEAIEGTIQKVTDEMGDIKLMHAEAIDEAKKQMAAKLDEALKKLLFSERNSSRGVSLLATKSLCLSCGRESNVKDHAHPISPRGLLPSLQNSQTPGPDVYRGGFKLPVSSTVGSLTRPKNNLSPPGSPFGVLLRNSSSVTELPYKHSNNVDPIMFSRSLAAIKYNPEDIKNAMMLSENDDDSGISGMIRQVVDIPVVAGLSVDITNPNEVVRPMYRKGFPSKKSNRPPVSLFQLLL